MSLINKDRLQLFWNRIKDAYFPKNITTGDTLATETYVNDSINQMSAYYITSDSNGNVFKTKLHLLVATKNNETYYGSIKRVPTKNDYTLIKNYDNNNSEYCGQYAFSETYSNVKLVFYSDKVETYSGDTITTSVTYDNNFECDVIIDGDIISFKFYKQNENADFYMDDEAYFFDEETLPNTSARFVYQKDEDSDGKWAFQYTVNATSFTQAQLDALNSTITLAKVEKIDNLPIEKGSGENSIVQKTQSGAENIAISESSVALGSLNTAGTKAYKWSTITDVGGINKLITLIDTPNGIVSGDRLSIVNKNHYDDCCKVLSVSNKSLLVDSLPFTTIEPDTGEDAKTLFVVSKPNVGNKDLGQCAHAEGGNTMATQMFSHAEGYGTKAIGQYSHSEGRETKSGYAAHAEGQGTIALGTRSHAEGYNTEALGNHSHAEGNGGKTNANNSHIEGFNGKLMDGAGAHIEGYGNVIDITESATVTDTATIDQCIGAHAEGIGNKCSAVATHAEGRKNVASAKHAHVEGYNNIASGISSHAEGNRTRAGVEDAPPEDTTATDGVFAHAEGNSTLAKGSASHAEGAATQSLSRASHAEGRHTVASGNYAHAEGFYTQTSNIAEHAEGRYNVSHQASTTLGDKGNTTHSVGIGTNDTNRMNAIEIMQDGKFYIKDIGGYTGTTIGGSVKTVQTVINGILNALGLTYEMLNDFEDNSTDNTTTNRILVLPDGVTSEYDDSTKTLTLNNVEVENYNNENKIIKLKTNN